MNPAINHRNKAWLAAIVCLVALVALNARTIHTAYSLWLDELATASLFADPAGGLWGYLMNDNFPPLYYLVLLGWGWAFGIGELSLRLPSLLAVIGAMATMGLFTFRYERGAWIWPAIAVAIVGTLPTVSYSAQDARPYALMLLLATLTITGATAMIKGIEKPAVPFNPSSFYLSAFLLSLTHYFGLILTLLTATVHLVLLDNRKRINTILLILACLVWPVIHASQGAILSGAGGNFWIEATPLIGPFKTLLITCPFTVLLPLLAPYWLFCRTRFPSSIGGSEKSTLFLFAVLIAFLGLMLAADFHTPLSIPRYYVAIIPVAALLVIELLISIGEVGKPKLASNLFLILLLLVIAAQAVKAQQRLELKSTPDQNWKSLAKIVRNSDICTQGCDAVGYTGWGDYYFQGVPISNYGNDPPRAFIETELARPLLGFHRGSGFIPALKEANPGMVCLEPIQAIKGSTFLMVDVKAMPGLIRQGLRVCSAPVDAVSG
jgi:hypothetical protein